MPPQNGGARVELRKAGAVPSLVALLRSSRLGVVKHSVMALGALLLDQPEAQRAAADAGEIQG